MKYNKSKTYKNKKQVYKVNRYILILSILGVEKLKKHRDYKIYLHLQGGKWDLRDIRGI